MDVTPIQLTPHICMPDKRAPKRQTGIVCQNEKKTPLQILQRPPDSVNMSRHNIVASSCTENVERYAPKDLSDQIASVVLSLNW